MKILLDMNISPEFNNYLNEHEIESVHWSSVGRRNAEDSEIFEYALQNNCVILTLDLDFGIILALTKGSKPSVMQIRTQDVYSNYIKIKIEEFIHIYKEYLEQGSIITIDEEKERVRILPI
ncbi:MAG: DUF5615 family PIN-like protein [Spirochaetia bacterium]